MRQRSGYLSLLLILSPFLSVSSWADPGKDLFDEQCSACHTIGGGDSGGPDLKGVAARRSSDWLARLIVEPDKLVAEKDPIQLGLVKKYGGEMPNLGLSSGDAQKIIAYLQGAATVESAAKPIETVVTPELVAQGKALFTSRKSFARGGPPCAACHGFGISMVTDGTLAVDLGNRFEGSGEQGFRGMLKSLRFPIMREVYADRPLTEEEITALVAFAKDSVARKAPHSRVFYPAAGSGIFICLIVVMALCHRRVR